MHEPEAKRIGPKRNARSIPPPPVRSMVRLGVTLVGCFLLLLTLGWVDYLTGYELGFFVFYSVPVGLAAWYAGRGPAVIIALAASVTWWLADRLNGVNYSSRFFFYWNLTIHFLAFVINAVTIAKIKRDLDERHRLLEELQRAKTSAPFDLGLPCPICGRQPARVDSLQSQP